MPGDLKISAILEGWIFQAGPTRVQNGGGI